MPLKSTQEWFDLLGHICWNGTKHFDKAVANVFGYNASKSDFRNMRFLRTIVYRFGSALQTEGSAEVLPRLIFLPIETNSIDLVVIPNVLESAPIPIRSCVRSPGY